MRHWRWDMAQMMHIVCVRAAVPPPIGRIVTRCPDAHLPGRRLPPLAINTCNITSKQRSSEVYVGQNPAQASGRGLTRIVTANENMGRITTAGTARMIQVGMKLFL